MSDLSKAFELERLRYMEVLDKLNIEERERIRRQNAEFASQGLFQSGSHVMATTKARLDKIESSINARLDIRKDLARSFPELGSERDLDELLAAILRTLEHAADSPIQDVPTGAVRNALKARVDGEIYSLQARARTKIEILKRECALKLHEQQDVRSVSITTGDGPALVNLGTIHGDVQQVINVVHEAGHAELADLLRQLAAAISETEALGEARADYLEQVRFIAEQATLPPEERQTGVVKGLVLGLRTGLQDAAHLAGILNLAGPAIASVFGVPWPF